MASRLLCMQENSSCFKYGERELYFFDMLKGSPFPSRFKAVRGLARMCPCSDSYEPSLLERISVIFWVLKRNVSLRRFF